MKLTRIKYSLFFLTLLSIVGWGPFSVFFPTNKEPFGTDAWLEKETRIIQSQAKNLDPPVLKRSLKAYLKARKLGFNEKDILTVIDYRIPSDRKRMWVIDLRRHKVLFNTWVTHGKNSGNRVPTSFSNQPGSLKSSLGVFLTENPYIGKHGYSLRLIGLERGFNHNAYKRAIVVHGAWYVGPLITGKSWGCPAVNNSLARPIIDTIKGKSLVFVYSNDRKWLNNSTFLAG